MKQEKQLSAETEALVLRYAHERPDLGQFSVAAELAKAGHRVSASTVRNIWKRHGLETGYQRLMAKSRRTGQEGQEGQKAQPPLSSQEQALLKRERRNRRLAADARTHDESISEARRDMILLAAARVFAAKGYAQASLKEVCSAAGIQPASLYYHFDSKEALFATVHHLGISQINQALDETAARHDDPWTRLEETCATALRFQLDSSELAVVVRVDSGVTLHAKLQKKINADRAAYEDRFRRQIEDLPLHPKADRTLLRLTLLGALNWTSVWYRPGRLDPAGIGRELIRIVFGYGHQRLPAGPATKRP